MRNAPSRSAAAPGTSHEARTRPVPNHTAPVEAGSRAAVERGGTSIRRTRGGRGRTAAQARRASRAHELPGGPVSGADIAGMVGPAGAGRPGNVPGRVRPGAPGPERRVPPPR
jgi:hypothetical protein